MVEDPVHNSPTSTSQSPASSSMSSQVQEEENDHEEQEQLLERDLSTLSGELTRSKEDTLSCIVVLLTFWFFASIALILGFYGASQLQLGPNCSHLLHVSSLLVNEIKVNDLSGPNSGLMLYGFHRVPNLDVERNWSETHNASIRSNSHKEWVYYLNEGSELKIDYTVRSKKSSPLSLVIAQGKDSFVEWIDDLSRPNPTRNNIDGSGTVQQKIFKPSYYYVALSNLNPEDVKVKLKFRIHAVLYNTSEANSKCSLAHGLCGVKLSFLGSNAAVLTSPAPSKNRTSDWYVNLSYEPRWISYFVGSGNFFLSHAMVSYFGMPFAYTAYLGAMTILMVLVFKLCNEVQSTRLAGVGFQPGERGPDRTPFLAPKEDDASSLGSSYESVSHDEEDAEDLSLETKGDTNHPRHVCLICFDAPRDCFFLPCGHCASCFTCGTRIIEEAGTCPICRRKMKKVRKIFTV